jgi:septum formation protein
MSDTILSRFNLLLASGSPRRRELLDKAGFIFRVQPVDVVEDYPDQLSPTEVPEYLAHKKAEAALTFRKENEIVIAADSIVLYQDTLFGKPQTEKQARETLTRLSGSMHQVLTGVVLRSSTKTHAFTTRSQVYFDEIAPDELNYYINRFNPYDKAGSYGIQDWIGWCLIYRIEGSYSNIMGLPVAQLYRALKEYF